LIGLAVGSDASYPWARPRTTRQAEQIAAGGEYLRREYRRKEGVLVSIETKPRDAEIALESAWRPTRSKGKEGMIVFVDVAIRLDQYTERNNKDQDVIKVWWDWIGDDAGIDTVGISEESCHGGEGSRKPRRAVGYLNSSLLVTVDIGLKQRVCAGLSPRLAVP